MFGIGLLEMLVLAAAFGLLFMGVVFFVVRSASKR